MPIKLPLAGTNDADDRLRRRAEQELTFLKMTRESGDWTLHAAKRIGAYLWDLWRQGAGINQPGEIVCRHVAVHLHLLMHKAGIRSRVDTWTLKQREAGKSQYGGHATLCFQPVLASGRAISRRWYYVDWFLRHSRGLDYHVGEARIIRKGAEGTPLEGLPLTRSGEVDVQYMANHVYGRDLDKWTGPMTQKETMRWMRQYVEQRRHIFMELYTKKAYDLVGEDYLKRLVLS